MLEVNENVILGAKIIVVGVGGCGNNTVKQLMNNGIQGADLICVNTDNQQLRTVDTYCKTLCIGERVTKGQGAGGDPGKGEQAAEESQEIIADLLEPYDMVFVTCGMGGGTGTGAAPVISKIAKDMKKLTVGVVTKPFSFENKRRMTKAIEGIERMSEGVDTLIIIPNDRILEIVDPKTPSKEAMRKTDEILQQTVQDISDLINVPQTINLDFADVQSVMSGKGIAHVGMGYGSGEDRGMDAIKMAVNSPLLETSLEGATDVMVNFTGDVSIGMQAKCMDYINSIVGEDVNIIIGLADSNASEGECKVSLIATGMEMNRKKSTNIDPRLVRSNGYVNARNTANPAFLNTPNTVGGVRTVPGQAMRPGMPAGQQSIRPRPVVPGNTGAIGYNTGAINNVGNQVNQNTGAVGVNNNTANMRTNDLQNKINNKDLNIPQFMQKK